LEERMQSMLAVLIRARKTAAVENIAKELAGSAKAAMDVVFILCESYPYREIRRRARVALIGYDEQSV
jgi:hypothetical protein